MSISGAQWHSVECGMFLISDVTSVGGGFVVNENTKTAGENLFYKGVDKRAVHVARLSKTSGGMDASQVEKDTDPTHPPYPFKSGDTLLALSHRHNVGVS